MTPAQRLAEWLDANELRFVDVFPVDKRPVLGEEEGWYCHLTEKDGRMVDRFRVEGRDAAITAALDAWQKGDG